MTTHTSLAWALERLAQLQGGNIDPLRMEAAQNELTTSPVDYFDLEQLCSKLGLAKPIPQMPIERVKLPLIGFHPHYGWGVIIDQQPSDDWLVSFMEGKQTLPENQLNHVAYIVANSKNSQHDSFDQVLKNELKRYRGVLFEAALATLLIGFITLGISMFSMQVYDRVIPTRGESTLITLSIGVVIAVIFELALKLARSHIMDSVVVGLDNRLSKDIFQRLLNIRIDQLPGSVGSLAAQVRGYEQIRSYYTASTLFALVDLPICIGFIIVIGFIGNTYIALVPLIFALLALAIGFGIRKRMNQLAETNAGASNRKTGLLVEMVEGSETIKAGAGGWKFLSRWLNFNAQTIYGDLQMRHASESVVYYVGALQQISYATLIGVGAYGVIEGTMTMGGVIACSIISGRIMAPIMTIPSLLVQQAHANAAKTGLESLYLLQSDYHGISRPLLPERLHGHFVLNDVRFAYGENPPAISLQQLQIKAGERIAILGAIGAGKSTILKLLAGLYKPQQGRVLIDNLDMAHISRQIISQHIGYLQQEHRLFHGTLRENLLIGLPDPGDAVLHQVLVRSGLIRMVSSHPQGLELTILEGGKGLSGGQRQLVAFTRILLCNPQILLLDEPTANMDGQQEAHCISILSDEIQQGKTFVVVTHKPSLLPLVDRIIVIAQHQVVMDGPRDEILAKMGARRVTDVTPIRAA